MAARAKDALTTASLSICLCSFQPSGGTFYISVWIRFSTVSAGSFSLNPNCRRIFGSRRATPAACQVRITLGHREEPWEILSRPVTWEASMRGCIGGGEQPTEGMNANNKEEKKKCERAFVHNLPSFQVIQELCPGFSVLFCFLFIYDTNLDVAWKETNTNTENSPQKVNSARVHARLIHSDGSLARVIWCWSTLSSRSVFLQVELRLEFAFASLEVPRLSAPSGLVQTACTLAMCDKVGRSLRVW